MIKQIKAIASRFRKPVPPRYKEITKGGVTRKIRLNKDGTWARGPRRKVPKFPKPTRPKKPKLPNRPKLPHKPRPSRPKPNRPHKLPAYKPKMPRVKPIPKMKVSSVKYTDYKNRAPTKTVTYKGPRGAKKTVVYDEFKAGVFTAQKKKKGQVYPRKKTTLRKPMRRQY